MQWAVASGKGGTGKTTLATNLACIAAQAGYQVTYLDCDVEEPNGHLFLRPHIHTQHNVTKLVPRVDLASCRQCGACQDFCRYHAIARVGQQVLVFDDLCHACGGCKLVCPAGAVSEYPLVVGRIRTGASGPVRFVDGQLHVGQQLGPPAIRAVKATLRNTSQNRNTRDSSTREPGGTREEGLNLFRATGEVGAMPAGLLPGQYPTHH